MKSLGSFWTWDPYEDQMLGCDALALEKYLYVLILYEGIKIGNHNPYIPI